jgi:hypothetical protein
VLSLTEITSLRQNQKQLLNSLAIAQSLLRGKTNELKETRAEVLNAESETMGGAGSSALLRCVEESEESYGECKRDLREMEREILDLIGSTWTGTEAR